MPKTIDFKTVYTMINGEKVPVPALHGDPGSDAEVTSEKIEEALGYTPADESKTALKEDLSDLYSIVSKEYPTQLYNRSECQIGFMDTSGKVYTGGSYDAYFYTPLIDVADNVGRTLKLSYMNNDSMTGYLVPKNARNIIAYDSYKTVLPSLGASNIDSYVIPEGVSFVRTCVSGNALHSQAEWDSVTTYSEWFEPQVGIKSSAINRQKTYYITYQTCGGGAKQVAWVNIPNKKNDVISFYGKFQSFAALRIGVGYETSYGSWLKITASNIELLANSGTSIVIKEHGIAISDFIAVTIARKANKNQAQIVLTSAGGTFSALWDFQGCNGDVFFIPAYTMTDCTLSYNMKDINADIFAFGDSYMTLGDSARYPKYILENGYTNMMMVGYGGITTNLMLPYFRRLIGISKPKYIVWALGMNDGSDGNTYTEAWKNGIDEVLSVCNEYKITPILATIPCVPNIDHTKKNEWVRNSGYRYIDFAKAVGAEARGATWYPDMLYTDNVHPAQLGAKALAARFMVDVPEAYEG